MKCNTAHCDDLNTEMSIPPFFAVNWWLKQRNTTGQTNTKWSKHTYQNTACVVDNDEVDVCKSYLQGGTETHLRDVDVLYQYKIDQHFLEKFGMRKHSVSEIVMKLL